MRTGRLTGGSATGKAGFLPAPGSAAARPDQEFPAEQPSHPSHSPETWAPSPRDPLPPTFIVPGVSKHSRPPSPKNAAEGKNGTVGSRSLQPSFAGLVSSAVAHRPFSRRARCCPCEGQEQHGPCPLVGTREFLCALLASERQNLGSRGREG